MATVEYLDVTDAGHLHLPGDDRVFVFGSNLAGLHGAGAARYAKRHLCAYTGQGEGLMPDEKDPMCYALPTKDRQIVTLPLLEIRRNVMRFLDVAASRPGLVFFVSKVGCGLAGCDEVDIAQMFNGAPGNCDLPPGWRQLAQQLI